MGLAVISLLISAKWHSEIVYSSRSQLDKTLMHFRSFVLSFSPTSLMLTTGAYDGHVSDPIFFLHPLFRPPQEQPGTLHRHLCGKQDHYFFSLSFFHFLCSRLESRFLGITTMRYTLSKCPLSSPYDEFSLHTLHFSPTPPPPLGAG